jgi:hypothetical protein
MQLANDKSPALVEDTERNAIIGGSEIKSHLIRVLTPSEIMRTLPSIGNGANNSVHHVHHPNVPSGSCPSPAPLQQQHHHQQQPHHPVAFQQHLQQQQQQQLHHHHSAVNATVHFVGLKYRPGNSCGMRIFEMDSLDQFVWILFIFFFSLSVSSPHFFLVEFSLLATLFRMNGRIKPSVHAYLSMIILILLISFAIFL